MAVAGLLAGLAVLAGLVRPAEAGLGCDCLEKGYVSCYGFVELGPQMESCMGSRGELYLQSVYGGVCGEQARPALALVAAGRASLTLSSDLCREDLRCLCDLPVTSVNTCGEYIVCVDQAATTTEVAETLGAMTKRNSSSFSLSMTRFWPLLGEDRLAAMKGNPKFSS